MKKRVGRMPALALALAASVCSGCSLLGSSYEMEIRPTVSAASQLQSLYVILSSKADVQEALASRSTYSDLLDEDLMRRYTSFVQFQPTEGGSWKLAFQGNQSKFVEYEIDDEVIEVKIDHELIETGMSEYCVVVLGFFGSQGFEQVTVNHASLDTSADQIVEVSGGNLSLRDA